MSSQKQNIKFVQFIEKNPCLYDPTCKGYNIKSLTDEAWRRIGAEFNFTVVECKHKWKNIRTVYRRHLFGKPIPGSDQTYSQNEYYLSSVLEFLKPTLKLYEQHHRKHQVHHRSAITSEAIEEDSGGTMMKTNTESSDADGDDTETYVDANINENGHEFGKIHVSQFKPPPIEPTPQRLALEAAMTNYFKVKATTSSGGDNVVEKSITESDELFLLSLKADMEEMTRSQKRQFKRRIYALIDDVLAGGSDEANS